MMCAQEFYSQPDEEEILLLLCPLAFGMAATGCSLLDTLSLLHYCGRCSKQCNNERASVSWAWHPAQRWAPEQGKHTSNSVFSLLSGPLLKKKKLTQMIVFNSKLRWWYWLMMKYRKNVKWDRKTFDWLVNSGTCWHVDVVGFSGYCNKSPVEKM